MSMLIRIQIVQECFNMRSDPACTKSRIDFLINLPGSGWPVIWISELQSETALSAMEAEKQCPCPYYSKLFLIMENDGEVGTSVGMSTKDLTTMNVSVHDDNSGTLILIDNLPPQSTPTNKYFATQTVWFFEENMKRGVNISKIYTNEKLGGMFTKGLNCP